MNNIDQEFIEFVVKSLVGKPEAVVVERRIDEKGVLLELTVDPEDLGRVIGKRGATAQSLRTLLRALGTKNDARYNLKIIDNGVGDHAHSSSSDSTSPPAPNSQGDDNVAAKPAQNNSSSDDSSDEPAQKEPSVSAEAHEDQTSARMRQARAELADLDDLDV